MVDIEWTRESEERLRSIHDYIAADNPAAAQRVAVQIYEKVQLLRDHPRLGQRYEPIKEREVREILFGHYRIPYEIVTESEITILGVFHSAQDLDRYIQ